MKAAYRKISYFVTAAILMASCQDEYNHPSQAGIPLAADINCDISVNQETNEVTFKMNNPGCNPVWKLSEREYSTVNGLTKVYATAGTYEVEIKISNSNGVSDASIIREFTLENTIVDCTRYYTMFGGDNSKEWVMARKEAGHLGCGESGSDGLGWYSAMPDEKASMGLYDNIMTFSFAGEYSFNPGDAGTVMLNKDCTIFPDFHTGEDFVAPVASYSTEYSFEVEGEDVILVLPTEKFLAYIPNDAIYKAPRFKVTSLKSNRIELVADEGTIAWHYIIVTNDGDDSGNGNTGGSSSYDPDSQYNMWKDCNFHNTFYYAPGWSQIGDPELKINGKEYVVSLPSATFEQWQAQVMFHTNMSTSSSSLYDFSVILNSNKNIAKATVKLVSADDENIFYFAENVSLSAYEDKLIVFTAMEGIDMDNVTLVFDFGGNPEGSEVTIRDVVLKDNANDDGSGGGNHEVPQEDNVNWDSTVAHNVWNTASFTNSFYYAPGWSQIGDPELKINGKEYVVSLPSATFEQWQAQVKFHTDISTNSETKYDFRCVINSNKNIGGVTVKLVMEGDDNVFYLDTRVAAKAYEDVEVKLAGFDGIDMEKVTLVFDFGSNPEGTEVTISEVLLKDSSLN